MPKQLLHIQLVSLLHSIHLLYVLFLFNWHKQRLRHSYQNLIRSNQIRNLLLIVLLIGYQLLPQRLLRHDLLIVRQLLELYRLSISILFLKLQLVYLYLKLSHALINIWLVNELDFFIDSLLIYYLCLYRYLRVLFGFMAILLNL